MNPILFFDIETAPDVSTDIEWFNARKEWNELRVSFLPEYNKIITIAVWRLNASKQVEVKTLTGNEAEMISQFYSYAGKYQICGWNILNFDLPFILKRWLKHNIAVPDEFKIADAKPWELKERFLDLARFYQGTTLQMASLEDVAIHLGIETPKGIMHGSEVAKYYAEWKIDMIAEYCRHDVRATGDIYKKFVQLNFM